MPPRAADEGTEKSSEEPEHAEKTTVFGSVAVTNITDDIRTALNLPKDVQGAVIADIDAESPAAKSGLREGDVIQEVNKQPGPQRLRRARSKVVTQTILSARIGRAMLCRHVISTSRS